MKREVFKNVRIAYMRNVGAYGNENKLLMEKFKLWVKNNNLDTPQCNYLSIVLDNHLIINENELRYDVGIIIDEKQQVNIDTRYLRNCEYEIYEVIHTPEEIIKFYENLSNIPYNKDLPIIERYCYSKLKNNICEICLPIG